VFQRSETRPPDGFAAGRAADHRVRQACRRPAADRDGKGDHLVLWLKRLLGTGQRSPIRCGQYPPRDTRARQVSRLLLPFDDEPTDLRTAATALAAEPEALEMRTTRTATPSIGSLGRAIGAGLSPHPAKCSQMLPPVAVQLTAAFGVTCLASRHLTIETVRRHRLGGHHGDFQLLVNWQSDEGS
jgi:hypothetical protein